MTTNENDDLIDGRRERVIFAEPTPSGLCLRFWCPWCDRWHQHGRPTPGSDETPYRVSHCFTADSPLASATYRLSEVEKVPLPRRRARPRFDRRLGRYVSGFTTARTR